MTIETRTNLIQYWQEVACSISAPLKDDVVQTSKENDSMAEVVAKIVDLQNDLKNTINNIVEIEKECMAVIDQLDNADQIQILYARYFQFKSWNKIAREVGCSYQWVYELHKRALVEVQKILDEKQSKIDIT